MSVSALGSQSSIAIQQLVDMRAQFDDLQRQLSTGQKAATFSGLGAGGGITVSLNAQLSALSSYDDTITNVSTRVNLMSTALGNMNTIAGNVKSALTQANAQADGGGRTVAQQTAQSSLGELVDLLNTQAGSRYLFSGRATDQPAVESYDHILNGDGARAGLSQLISERNQADLGADGLGRLSITSPGPTSISIDEDAGQFGLKLASVNSTLSNTAVTGPTGSPANISVVLSGQPNAGDAITLRFNLPDGSTENVTLTATTQSPPGPNQFTIGPNTTDTTTNLKTALTTAIGNLAGGALTAASAVAASNDFFNADANNPPMRVDGPPFDSATGMVAGTASNTVIWYTGEAGTDPARSTATARIDPSLTVSYGARANEDGIRKLVQNVATLAAVTINNSTPNASDLSTALSQRLTANLNDASGQTVNDVATDLASAQASLQAAQNRHKQTNATLSDYLQNITGVSNEQVGAEILSLQTRMQASMQTTAMLFQTSLVNYLK